MILDNVFDFIKYSETYCDISNELKKREELLNHYKQFGIKENRLCFKRNYNYEYNICEHILKNYYNTNDTYDEEELMKFMKENKDTIEESYLNIKNTSKISYNYYKLFSIKVYKYIHNLYFNEDMDNINCFRFIPPYKLLLPRDEYIKYGVHRFGWGSVITSLLDSNYGESNDFHFDNPSFEWIQHALFYNYNDYQTTIEKSEIKEEFRIPFIIFDDWLEKSFGWGKKMKRRKYEHKFISFVHDPPVEDIMNNDMSFFMNRKKLDMELRIDNDNVKELEKMKILIPLTKYLEDNIKSKKKYNGAYISALHHPLSIFDSKIDKSFNFDSYKQNDKKRIYLLGWWLRKYDIFLKMNAPDFEKIIILKDKEGIYVKDYTLYEIRKSTDLPLDNIDNNKYQNSLTEYENDKIKSEYNTIIKGFLPNDEYDDIFTKNIIFLDFYTTSANNVILECIAFNTPLLVCYHTSIVEYLGKDYPLYFNNKEEANEKINNIDLIKQTHIYLKNMDKTKFTTLYFNKKIAKKIIDCV